MIKTLYPYSKFILLIFYFILLIAYFFSKNIPMNEFFFTILLLMIVIALFIFVVNLRLIYGKAFSFLSISFIFILSYSIVHFQFPSLYSLGYTVKSQMFNFIWASEKSAAKAFLISIIGLYSFTLGFLLTNQRDKNDNSEIKIKDYNHAFNILIILSYIFYILFFLTSGSYSSGQYFANDQLIISNYFFSLFSILLSSCIVIKTYQFVFKNYQISLVQYLKNFGYPLLFLSLWHILFSLYIGDRGNVIIFASLLFGFYYIRINKMNFIKFFIFLFILSSLMTVVGLARFRGDTDLTYFQRVKNSTYKFNNRFDQDEHPLTETIELALSVRCLNHAVENVPSKYNYSYGYFQFFHLSSAVPGLNSIILNFIKNNDWKYNGPSNFITFLIQGNSPKYGDGSSSTSDLYLDFGIFGVIGGLFLFGMFLRKNENFLISKPPPSLFIWIVISVYFSNALYLGRSSLLFPFQKIIMIYFFIIIFNKIRLYSSNN